MAAYFDSSSEGTWRGRPRMTLPTVLLSRADTPIASRPAVTWTNFGCLHKRNLNGKPSRGQLSPHCRRRRTRRMRTPPYAVD
ncbi:hypothetical protein PHYSODRAFT_286526 [Phytophthora sojae]|uniref:Uncharacterized protein n=1 Tax=Phytophthora sojae (strain P6497) TaxID=1094619 RepID=G4ZS99_PHYSP|nr:hypothetical protein PHYSODRAFT_286526 [Phytophthora sojae]EGZ12995.1 hypothetical protein PHYSODRAFT_286526 [Phytophthora sojae]|eukprot:XP_009530424.1 hypothetical protein PHYSODRAFT_286526 [Phytophthora sojae]